MPQGYCLRSNLSTYFCLIFNFFLQVLRLYTTLRAMTDLKYLYIRALAWLLPFIYPLTYRSIFA